VGLSEVGPRLGSTDGAVLGVVVGWSNEGELEGSTVGSSLEGLVLG
jgi:hypothetical protein